MSGTASRFQGRFGYAPGLRVGTYPGASAPSPLTALATGQTPSIPFTPTPAPAAQTTQATYAPPAPPVMAGSMMPDRRNGYDGGGAGESAQGGYGGPGPSGMASTGNFGQDALGFGSAVGQAALGAVGPSVVGSAVGAIGAGIAAALGAPQTADAIAETIGLQGPVTGFDPNAPNPAAYGEASPGSTEGGLKGEPGAAPNTSVSFGSDFGLGGDGAGAGGSNSDNSNSNSTSEGQDASGGNDGSGAGGPGTGAGAPGNDSGDWMRGGYTGAGPDGTVQPNSIAGRVHEGEVVIPAANVQRYGLAPLLMLARGQAEPSRLAALLRG